MNYVVWLQSDNTNRSGFYNPGDFQDRTRDIAKAKRLTKEEAFAIAYGANDPAYTILEIIG